MLLERGTLLVSSTRAPELNQDSCTGPEPCRSRSTWPAFALRAAISPFAALSELTRLAAFPRARPLPECASVGLLEKGSGEGVGFLSPGVVLFKSPDI